MSREATAFILSPFYTRSYDEAMQNFISYNEILQNTSSNEYLPANLPGKSNSGVDCCQITNIDYLFGNALEILPCLLNGNQDFCGDHPKTNIYEIPAKRFDMVFIDGMFRRTLDFFQLVQPLLLP